MSMDPDAGYAIAAFLGAGILLGIDKIVDRKRTDRDHERLGWAELFKVGSEIRRSVEELMGEPHPITGETPSYPSDEITAIIRTLHTRIDRGIEDLYILAAQHPKGELGEAIQRTSTATSEWLKISGLTSRRRFISDENRKREKGELIELQQQLAHVEERLKSMGK